MKKLLWLRVVPLFMGATAISAFALSGSKDRDVEDSIRNPLIGPWRLVWLEEPGAVGKVHRADCTGLLVYTSDGHMSVQVMYRNPQTSQGGPVQYAQGGYEASFGRYEIDKRAHAFTFHVEGALVRTLVGKHLKRVYQLSGKQLIVKSPDPNEHWRVAWEHY